MGMQELFLQTKKLFLFCENTSQYFLKGPHLFIDFFSIFINIAQWHVSVVCKRSLLKLLQDFEEKMFWDMSLFLYKPIYAKILFP